MNRRCPGILGLGIHVLSLAANAGEDALIFEGNAHGESFRMPYNDFYELENPRMGIFSRHRDRLRSELGQEQYP